MRDLRLSTRASVGLRLAALPTRAATTRESSMVVPPSTPSGNRIRGMGRSPRKRPPMQSATATRFSRRLSATQILHASRRRPILAATRKFPQETSMSNTIRFRRYATCAAMLFRPCSTAPSGRTPVRSTVARLFCFKKLLTKANENSM